MPGIHILFDQDIYDEIPSSAPGKKRGWIRDLVIAEVIRRRGGVTVTTGTSGNIPEYTFRLKGKVYHGPGVTPAEAARALGIDMGPLVEWRTVAEAEKEGWFEEVKPLDV